MILLISSIGLVIALLISISKTIKALRKEDFKSAKTWGGIVVGLIILSILIGWLYSKLLDNEKPKKSVNDGLGAGTSKKDNDISNPQNEKQLRGLIGKNVIINLQKNGVRDNVIGILSGAKDNADISMNELEYVEITVNGRVSRILKKNIERIALYVNIE